jgi:electron transfer flavoprotein alpha subunit
VAQVKKFPGITKVYSATSDALENPYGGAMSVVAKNLIEKNGYDKVIALSSSFGKDVVPRIGGLLDL